jgi:hypothetical protein
MAYPIDPGHRGGDTDMAAAGFVKATAKTYEALTYALLSEQPRTADEVHAAIEQQLGKAVPLYTIRPRLSQLKARGLLVDTGERRLSSAGRCKQRVMRVASPAEQASRNIDQAELGGARNER